MVTCHCSEWYWFLPKCVSVTNYICDWMKLQLYIKLLYIVPSGSQEKRNNYIIKCAAIGLIKLEPRPRKTV